MNRHMIVPYLMGQRRSRLMRVCELGTQSWDVIETAECTATEIADRNEQMRSMGLVYARLAARVREVAAAGDRPVSIAGDCVSTLGMLAGLQQAHREPQRILWLDAHGDFHTWNTTRTYYLGGMPLAMLVGRQDRRRAARDSVLGLRYTVGCLPYPEQQVLLSDARDLDPGEDEALRESRVQCCSIDEILPLLSPDETLYVHFDTDVVDAQDEMPALKYHVKNGPGIEDMEALFWELRGFPVVAVSVSAWHAEKDEGDRAARICLDLLETLLQD
jgi:arginase